MEPHLYLWILSFWVYMIFFYLLDFLASILNVPPNCGGLISVWTQVFGSKIARLHQWGSWLLRENCWDSWPASDPYWPVWSIVFDVPFSYNHPFSWPHVFGRSYLQWAMFFIPKTRLLAMDVEHENMDH